MDSDGQAMPVIKEDEEREVQTSLSEEEVEHHNKIPSVDQLRKTFLDEDEFDTDLENEQEVEDFDVTGRNLYLSACNHFSIVPVNYFLRHMQDPHLVMKHHGLGGLEVKAMALALQNNTHVVDLDLESNWMEGIGGTFIAQMLKENIYISDLNLANNNLGTVGAAQICEMLTINTTLQGLNLSGNNFTDSDSVYFVEALTENRRLQYLNLSHNKFSEKAAFILGHAVGENETLEELDLSWNYFRTRGAVEICDSVKNNARLKIVDLSFNGLGKEGGYAVADIIKVNNVLLQLDVSHNRIPAETVDSISKYLESNDTLKVFKICYNPIGIGGAKSLLRGISPDSNIIELLDMSGIEVDKEFMVQKEAFLETTKKTTVLHGGLICDYIIKGPPRSKMRVLLTTPLDEIDPGHILQTIKDHCCDKSFPIKDVMLDKLGENCKLCSQDFVDAIQAAGVCLGEDETRTLNNILKKIDTGGIECNIFVHD